MKTKLPEETKLTVVIRNLGPMFYAEEPPTHRTVQIQLTDEQLEKLRLKVTHGFGYPSIDQYEEISNCFLEE